MASGILYEGVRKDAGGCGRMFYATRFIHLVRQFAIFVGITALIIRRISTGTQRPFGFATYSHLKPKQSTLWTGLTSATPTNQTECAPQIELTFCKVPSMSHAQVPVLWKLFEPLRIAHLEDMVKSNHRGMLAAGVVLPPGIFLLSF
ncbi:hypothetical protein EAE99_009905 [Botrytis elliptica]|nr:hypothetical protein EAE99_009905 [Botrytis elliptica]